MEILTRLAKWITSSKIGICLLIVVSIAILALIVAPFVMYYIYIGNKIGSDAERWGQFGDFFGGTLNPIFSLLTLIVTIYIAFALAKLDDKRNAESIAFEKRRFLTELRESEYRRITAQLNRTLHLLADDPKLANSPERKAAFFKLKVDFRSFINENSHLFPFLKEEVCTNLAESLDTLYKLSQQKAMTQDEINSAIKSYGRSFKLFTTRIQQFILASM